jgi:hypothetical protein
MPTVGVLAGNGSNHLNGYVTNGLTRVLYILVLVSVLIFLFFHITSFRVLDILTALMALTKYVYTYSACKICH